MNKFQTTANFGFAAAVYAAKAGESSQAAGVVSFKFAKTTWGGSCCKLDNSGCESEHSLMKCNQLTGSPVNNLKLFSTNSNKRISHGFYNKASGAKKLNALTGLKMIGVMDMPTAHFTTMRGRGGFGSSSQKLVDIFWQMTTSTASSTAVQTLLHFYVHVKTAVTDANMKVGYGFPINTYSATAGASKNSGNNGAIVLSTGMKIYVAAGDVPLADYYGFHALRMIPFWKSTGGNEIEVVVNSARAVQCWSWGSAQGEGWASIHNPVWATYFTAKYFALMQYAQMNMVICKIGTAAGTATTGDVIVIPATQKAPDATNVNNPLPKYASATPVLSSGRASVVTAANTNNKNLVIIAGTDQYLGTMTKISNADTNLDTVIQAADLVGTGASGHAAFPTAISNLNDNASGRVWDIVAKTGSEWIIGATKLAALLRFKLATAATWTDPQAVLTVCGPQAGSVIPTTTEMTSGSAGTGTACTAAFLYTVHGQDALVVTGYSTRAQRWCRWCNAADNSGVVEVYLKDFVPPTTSTRLLKGISAVGSSTGGAASLAVATQATATLQESVVVGSSGCGKSGQTTKKSTKGQSVEFTMKSPVPLAAGQFVIWEDVTSGGVKNW
jgi:hypothetical protein